jgi:hypothetical protein
VEISAGPAIVKPNGTVVFSQRLRGSGEYKNCKVSFTLSDARRTSQIKEQIDEPPKWVKLKEVSVSLSSAQVMEYRCFFVLGRLFNEGTTIWAASTELGHHPASR